MLCVWTSWGMYNPPAPGLLRGPDKRSGKNLVGGPTDSSPSLVGTGQTVGLVEFDTFHVSDVSNFLGLMGLPTSQIGQSTQVHVAGGAPLGIGESEVLLDIDTVLFLAPGADVIVYDAPASGTASSRHAQRQRNRDQQ